MCRIKDPASLSDKVVVSGGFVNCGGQVTAIRFFAARSRSSYGDEKKSFGAVHGAGNRQDGALKPGGWVSPWGLMPQP